MPDGTRIVSPAAYDRIGAVIAGVDQLATDMEARWGVGRLRLLVDDDLRERFDRQVRLWNDAIVDHELADIETHGAAMRRGWQVLDQVATAAGARQLDPDWWEISTADGRVVAFTRTNAEAHALVRAGRYLEVWTVDEIARVIERFPEVAKAKQVFPGATVESVRSRNQEAFDWARGDEVPL